MAHYSHTWNLLFVCVGEMSIAPDRRGRSHAGRAYILLAASSADWILDRNVVIVGEWLTLRQTGARSIGSKNRPVTIIPCCKLTHLLVGGNIRPAVLGVKPPGTNTLARP